MALIPNQINQSQVDLAQANYVKAGNAITDALKLKNDALENLKNTLGLDIINSSNVRDKLAQLVSYYNNNASRCGKDSVGSFCYYPKFDANYNIIGETKNNSKDYNNDWSYYSTKFAAADFTAKTKSAEFLKQKNDIESLYANIIGDETKGLIKAKNDAYDTANKIQLIFSTQLESIAKAMDDPELIRKAAQVAQDAKDKLSLAKEKLESDIKIAQQITDATVGSRKAIVIAFVAIVVLGLGLLAIVRLMR